MVSLSFLRTLLLAYKRLSQTEYDNFYTKYHKASNLIDGREEKVSLPFHLPT